MGLTLSSAQLPGISARNSIGEYVIDAASFVEEETSEEGVISRIWDITKGLAGFIWKGALSLLKLIGAIDFRRVWGWLVNTQQFIWNFDFGATDVALSQQINQYWAGVVGQVGGLVGQSLGWLLCGALPGVVITKINKAAGLTILREVGEEALDELSAALYGLTNTLVNATVRSLFVKAYAGIRRWLRQPGNPFYELLPESLRQAWREGKSWRISTQIEERIEAIPNQGWENFTEETLEEFGDACIEAGYVVAGGLDAYVSEQRRGTIENVVEVTPNREYPEDKFILAGPEDEIRTTLPLMIANHQMMDQKDVGVISTIETSQLFTQAMPLQLYVKIEWRSDRGNQGPRPCYQVSSVKRSKVGDYEFIRQIAGGNSGYLWGRFKAVASMSDSHFITCYGGTESVAETRCLALATLSDAEVQLIQVTEEKRAAKRLTTPGLQKESTQVYPHRIIIINREYFAQPRPNSRASKRGYYVPVEAALSIRSATKPLDWDETVGRILRGPSASNPA